MGLIFSVLIWFSQCPRSIWLTGGYRDSASAVVHYNLPKLLIHLFFFFSVNQCTDDRPEPETNDESETIDDKQAEIKRWEKKVEPARYVIFNTNDELRQSVLITCQSATTCGSDYKNPVYATCS